MISDLFIQATWYSPEITLLANGRISISGRCIPREPDEFFAPVMDWASAYSLEPAEETVIDISIEYINGTNSGKMYWFLRKLKEVTALGKKIEINFTFEADDEWMNDYGLAIQEQLKIPVNMIVVEKLNSPVMVPTPPYKSNNLPSE